MVFSAATVFFLYFIYLIYLIVYKSMGAASSTLSASIRDRRLKKEDLVQAVFNIF